MFVRFFHRSHAASMQQRRFGGARAMLSIGLLALIAARCVDADDAAPASADQSTTGEIETAAIAAIADAQAVQDERAMPASTRVTFYVGQNRAAALVEHLSLVIDQNAPLELPFNPAMANALADSQGLRRVEDISLAPGLHKVHATLRYVYRYAASPQTLTLDWDGVIDKQPGQLSVEIRLQGQLSGSSVQLETEQWQLLAQPENWFERAVRGVVRRRSVISLFHPGDDHDPAMRYARYLLALGAPEAALIALRRIARADDAGVLPVDFWLQTARGDRAANLLDDAAALGERLKSLGADRAQIAVERLQLGKAEYRRGDLAGAQALLLRARADVPPVQALNWRFAYAQVLFAQNRVAEASEILKTPDSDYVEALRYMNDPVESLRETGYGRYNLAVALLARGDEQLGLSWLDLVGRADGADEQILALRDKANLTLGWHFLKARQGRTALGILGRVREQGPFSDAALLGIGWSELVPAGDTHWRSNLNRQVKTNPDYVQDLGSGMRHSLLQLKVLEPELHGELGPRRFAKDRPAADRKEGLQRALRLWSALLDQHGDTAAAQEAALAIGYAYDQLHDGAHAREAYSVAVQKLELAQKTLHANADAIRAEQLTTQVAQSKDAFDLLQTLGAFGFAPEALNPDFYAQLDRYRANARLIEAIIDLQTGLAKADSDSKFDLAKTDAASDAPIGNANAPIATGEDVLLARLQRSKDSLTAEQQALAPKLDQDALAQLDAQQRKLQQYLQAAYFSAARVQDARSADDKFGP